MTTPSKKHTNATGKIVLLSFVDRAKLNTGLDLNVRHSTKYGQNLEMADILQKVSANMVDKMTAIKLP